MRIAIRADASVQIGSGHVMRCLTLANALRERGAQATFICREHPGHLFSQIEDAGHRLIALPPPVATTKEGRLAHSAWLGTSQAEDAEQVIAALKSIGHVDWLVVDHYAIDREWESPMRRHAAHIMTIDDLADRVHDCDVLLDQNLHREDMAVRYAQLLPAHCRMMLGPRYALLRPEFKQARDLGRVRDGSLKRIFVFFGGADPTGETGKALQAIRQLGRPDLAVDVVVGAANPRWHELDVLCEALPNAKLYRQIDNIAELMIRADLAIGAGGGVTWERCCLGLPAIVASIALNQEAGCKTLAKQGAILYLGEAVSLDAGLLQAALEVVSHTPELLLKMTESSASIVDGKGCMRVVNALTISIELRPARQDDCEVLFKWRNTEETRRFSGNNDPIDFEKHAKWFANALEDENRIILIGEVEGKAVGVLRFDRHEKSATISVYLVPGHHGNGIGGQLIACGNAWLGANWPELEQVEALIMERNAPSVLVFTEAGFEKISCRYVKTLRG